MEMSHLSCLLILVNILSEEQGAPSNTGGSLYDGRRQVLYWADASCEVVFIVPSPDTYHERRRASLDSVGGE
jgi:hypothetical protein